MAQLRKKATPLDKYIFMHTIQDSDETLFYALLVRHTRETMPFVYTPTVGISADAYFHALHCIVQKHYLGQVKPVRSGVTFIDTPRAVCI